MALTPDDFIVRLKRGEFFLRLGLYAEALNDLQIASRLPAPEEASKDYARRLLVQTRERSKGMVTRRPALPHISLPHFNSARLALPRWLSRKPASN